MLVTGVFSIPTMFSSLSNTEIIILATMNLSSANAFNLDYAKILLFGKGFKNTHAHPWTATLYPI